MGDTASGNLKLEQQEGGGKAMKSRITIFFNVVNKHDYLRLKVLFRDLR